MQLEHMEYIVKVADIGSISKASKQLFIHQQQLSKIIQNVEQELNIVIFERTYRGIVLTELGNTVVDTFKKILETYATLEKYQKSKMESQRLSGELFLRAYPSMRMENDNNTIRIINLFASQYPEVAIFYSEGQTEENIKFLKENINYIGVIVQPQNDIINAIEIPEKFVFIPVLKSKLVVYGSKEHPFIKNYRTTTIRALQKEPLVLYRASDDLNKTLAPLLNFSERLFVKYTVDNIQSFYDILKKREGANARCLS